MSLKESLSYLNKLYDTTESFVSIANGYMQENDNSYESFLNNHRNHLDEILQELIVSNEDKLIRRVNCFIDEISLRAEIYRFAINSEVKFWKEKKYRNLSIDNFILDNPDVKLYEKILHKGKKNLDEIRDEQIHNNQRALVLLLFIEHEFVDFLRKLALTFQDLPDFKTQSQTYILSTKIEINSKKDIKSPAPHSAKAIKKPSEDFTGKKWLTNSEVGKLLDVTLRTLQNYRDEGKIPFSQVGKKIYYKASDIDKHFENHYFK